MEDQRDVQLWTVDRNIGNMQETNVDRNDKVKRNEAKIVNQEHDDHKMTAGIRSQKSEENDKDMVFVQKVEQLERFQHGIETLLKHAADEVQNLASEFKRPPFIMASALRERSFDLGHSKNVKNGRNGMAFSERQIRTEMQIPFLRTNAYNAIVKQLKRNNLVVVTGHPGNGKRSLAFQCAKTFQEEKQMKPFIVQHHQDWQVNISLDNNLFIIMQDFCEVDIFSAEFCKNVKNHIAGISFSIHDECTPRANKLLIILKKEVLHFMNQLYPEDIRFTEEFVIDISSPKMRLTYKEKQEMLITYQVKSREDESALIESEFPFGFSNACHSCETFSEFPEYIEKFVSNQIQSIEPEFFLALAVVCLNGGKMKMKDIYENETYAILHRTFKQTTYRFARDVCMNLPFVVDLLTDVYFTKVTENDTTYLEYLHKNVNENVASIVLKTNAGLVFQLAPLNRLQYFRSKLQQVSTGFSTNTIFDWIIQRITSELCLNTTESVMQCIIALPEWDDEDFINMILANEKIGEACRDLKTYQQENFLVCAIKWKSLNITRLLFHWLRKKLFLKLCQENNILMKVVETGFVQMFQLLNDLGVTLKDKSPTFESLFTAVKNNHLPMLSFLTQHMQIDSSFKDAYGCALLHCAAKSGSMDVMEYLIGQGLDTNVRSVENETILHWVAMLGCFSTFKGLCERFPEQIRTKTSTGKSVLHYAAANKDANILKYLIENIKMNPFDKTQSGETVLHIACSNEANNVVRHVLEHHPDVIGAQDKNGMTAAHTACASGNLEAIKLLSQFDELFKISSKEGESVLHCSSMSGSLETIKFVMNLTSHLTKTLTAKGYSLLHVCTSSPKGNLDIMQYLIDQGFDVRQRTEEGQTTLHLACSSGNLRLVRFLFIKFPELFNARDVDGYDAILSSAKGRSLETLKYLDDMQCFIRQTLTDGKGILHIACKHSSVDVVRYLCLKYPQEIERRDSEGKTALHMSALNASLDVIQYMLDIEVDHYAISRNKQTILHLACFNSNTDILKYITEMLPDLKYRKDCRGYNALHCSCEARNERAMKFLLNECNDFDVHQRTFENFTPLDIVFVNSTYRYEERTVNALKTIADEYIEQGCSGSELPERMFRDISQYQENLLKYLHACDFLDLAVYPKRLRGIRESKILAFCLLFADSLNNEQNINNHAKAENIVSRQLFHFAKYKKHHQCTFPEILLEIGLTWSMDWCVKIAFLFPQQITAVCLRSSLKILRSGVSPAVVKSFARGISKTFFMKYGDVLNIHSVWAGFLPLSLEKNDHCIDTIVVITKKKHEEMQTSLDEYHGLKIYFRDAMHFSPEAKEMLLLESDALCNLKLRKEDIQRLMKNHSNILLVSTSSIKSIGYGTPNQQTLKHLKSVVIYCRVKGIIPAGEKLFPTHFGGYPVDVRESAVTLAVGQEGSKMGDRVGLTEGDKTGTLGGFVNIDGDRKGFITCAHVLTSLDGQTYNVRNRKPRVSIIDDRGTKHFIGRIDKYALDLDRADVDVTIDAALVEMQNKMPDSGHFTSNLRLSDIQQADFRNYDELSFTDGETATIEECRSGMVLKVGAASGLTRGHVHFENAEAVIEEKSVVLNDKRHALRGQIEVRPYNSDYFIRDGDSGSFVFLIANGSPPVLKCVGLAVARTDHGTCLMTPIENVLSRFNLTIDQLSKFGNAPQEEDILSKMFQNLEKNMNDQFAATNVNMSAIRDTVERMENRLVEVESAVFNNPEDGRLNCTLL